MVHSDTSNGFLTLDLVTYVFIYSKLLDEKIFEFEILNVNKYISAE